MRNETTFAIKSICLRIFACMLRSRGGCSKVGSQIIFETLSSGCAKSAVYSLVEAKKVRAQMCTLRTAPSPLMFKVFMFPY